MRDLWTARAWVWAVGLSLLAACGDDNETGGNDNVWTGVSGVVIAVILIAVVWAALRRRGR